jgi:O-antigen/teichoic acid export membrane protein
VSDRWRIGIARNITWLASANLLVKPFWLLFIVVLCWRYLGTVGFGVFSTALWLAYIPASLTDLGLTRLTVRDVARSPQEASEYFSNLLFLRLAIAPLALLIAVGAGVALGYETSMIWAVLWASIYAIGMLAMIYVRAFFHAFQNLRLEGISMVVEKVLVIGLGIVGLVTIRTADGTLALMALGLLIALVMNILWVSGNLARLDRKIVSRHFVKSAVVRALPLGLYAVFIVINLRIGAVLLEHWHGAGAAGEFAPAFRILEALFLLPAVFSAAIFPRLSALYHDGQIRDFRFVITRTLAAATGLAVVFAALISLLSPELMALANPGEPHEATADILASLVWVFPLMTTKDLLIVALVASDRQRYLAWGLGIALGFSLVLHYILTMPQAATGLITVFFLVESGIVCALVFELFRVMASSER